MGNVHFYFPLFKHFFFTFTTNIQIDIKDSAADDLVNGALNAIKKYILVLAENKIRLASEQAEKELTDLHQRTKKGIETARLNGKQIGQPEATKQITKKSIEAKEKIRKYNRGFEGALNDMECIKLIGISRGSYYKYKIELNVEG